MYRLTSKWNYANRVMETFYDFGMFCETQIVLDLVNSISKANKGRETPQKV